MMMLAAACGGDGDGAGADGGGGGGGGGDDGPTPVLGEPHTGQYHLGPVAWTGAFWNACAPYPEAIQATCGERLAGLNL